MASSKITLFFFIVAAVALASAIPAPQNNPAGPRPIAPVENKEAAEQLEASEGEKDLKGSESIGYGYYGYPYTSYYGGYYPYTYSTYYGGGYYPYSYGGYRGFGGLYGWY